MVLLRIIGISSDGDVVLITTHHLIVQLEKVTVMMVIVVNKRYALV